MRGGLDNGLSPARAPPAPRHGGGAGRAPRSGAGRPGAVASLTGRGIGSEPAPGYTLRGGSSSVKPPSRHDGDGSARSQPFPRPLLERDAWTSLDGPRDFVIDREAR